MGLLHSIDSNMFPQHPSHSSPKANMDHLEGFLILLSNLLLASKQYAFGVGLLLLLLLLLVFVFFIFIFVVVVVVVVVIIVGGLDCLEDTQSELQALVKHAEAVASEIKYFQKICFGRLQVLRHPQQLPKPAQELTSLALSPEQPGREIGGTGDWAN